MSIEKRDNAWKADVAIALSRAAHDHMQRRGLDCPHDIGLILLDALLPLLSDNAFQAGAEGWQPIETAPKDGTEVLGWFVWYPHGLHGREEYAERGQDIMHWTDFNSGGWVRHHNGTPTHWRPLPLPPIPLKESTGV